MKGLLQYTVIKDYERGSFKHLFIQKAIIKAGVDDNQILPLQKFSGK